MLTGHFAISAVLSLLMMVAAFVLGWSAPANADVGSDASLGAAAGGIASGFVLVGLIAHGQLARWQPRSNSAELRRRLAAAQSPALVAMLTVVTTLAIPTALVAARASQAVTLRGAAMQSPAAIVGSSVNAGVAVPGWVGITDVHLWMVRPFLSNAATTAVTRAKCGGVSNSSLFEVTDRSAWWADAYLADRQSACFDTYFGPTTVYLWPPATGAYAGSRPIAVAADARQYEALDATVAAFFSSGAQAAKANVTGVVTWFRAPEALPWLSAVPTYDPWYHCTSGRNAWCSVTGWGSVAGVRRTILVNAASWPDGAPDALVWRWLAPVIALPCASVGVFALLLIPTYVGWRLHSSAIPDLAASAFAAVSLSPLWAGAFGAYCWATMDTLLCYMDDTSSTPIITVFGFVGAVLFYVIGTVVVRRSLDW